MHDRKVEARAVPMEIVEELKSVVGSGALADIILKRTRQITQHGWTREHDDTHIHGELAQAAIPYIQSAWNDSFALTYDELQVFWPWEEPFNPKPTDDRRELLLNAAALLVAEIERLDRAAGVP